MWKTVKGKSKEQTNKVVENKTKEVKNESLPQNTNGAKTDLQSQKKEKPTLEKKAKVLDDKIKKFERAAYSEIDTAMTYLNYLPEFTDIGMDFLTSNFYSYTENPLVLLFKLLDVIGVTDEDIRKWLVSFLINVLPEVEIGVKAALLANIKSIVSCSADPRIPKKLRQRTGEYYFDALRYKYSIFADRNSIDYQRGMLIDADSIDPEGILAFSPYEPKGMNNYFGIINDEMRLFYEEKTFDETVRYGTEEDDKGNVSVVKRGDISNASNKWELCRAVDKNAFLWFVMHCARFPSPTPVKIDKKYVVTDKNKYLDDTSVDARKTTLLAPNFLVLENDEESEFNVGSTIVNEKSPTELSICTGAFFNDSSVTSAKTTDLKVVSNIFVPVSSNWNSADWYVNKKDYFSFGNKINYNKSIVDYSEEEAICNIQYMQPTDYATDYVGGSTQKFNLTILPKPYVYLPYLNTGEPLWRMKKILFDAYGNPDPNGNFSLPTEKMTTKNKPYVHNDNITFISDTVGVIKAVKEYEKDDNSYKNIMRMVYFETVDGNPSNDKNQKSLELVKKEIINKYKDSCHIRAFYLVFKTWKPDNDNDFNNDTLKSKTLSVLKDCFNTLLRQEGGNTDSKYVKLNVGETDDNCALFINKKTGEYHLAPSSGSTVKDYTKHLVRCYKGLTVYEFNYDYIMGMKLFSPKVVCAKLLSASTNPIYRATFRLDINNVYDDNKYDYFGDKQSILEIIEKIVAEEDTELSDCFFKFSNNDYENMLKVGEEKRYHQQPYLNNKNETVDFSEVFKILNNYPENGTKVEQSEVLNNAIAAATAKVAKNQNVYAKQDSKKTKLNFTTDLLSVLAAILIQSLLSPKVLMLIAVNKQLMGDGGETFNARDLLNGMRGLIIGVIKELRDLIIKKLLDYVLDALGPLAAEMLTETTKEKESVYYDILIQLVSMYTIGKQSFERFKYTLRALLNKYRKDTNGKWKDYDLPTVLDDVNYADILDSDKFKYNTEKPFKNNC